MTRTHKKVTEPEAIADDDGPSDDAPSALCLGPGGSAEAVQRAVGKLDGRWKLTIVFRLFAEPVQRFSVLERSIPGVSHKMLVAHLRELERDGVVQRTVHPTVPPKVEYRLTEAGLALRPILLLLRDWSVRQETQR